MYQITLDKKQTQDFHPLGSSLRSVRDFKLRITQTHFYLNEMKDQVKHSKGKHLSRNAIIKMESLLKELSTIPQASEMLADDFGKGVIRRGSGYRNRLPLKRTLQTSIWFCERGTPLKSHCVVYIKKSPKLSPDFSPDCTKAQYLRSVNNFYALG